MLDIIFISRFLIFCILLITALDASVQVEAKIPISEIDLSALIGRSRGGGKNRKSKSNGDGEEGDGKFHFRVVGRGKMPRIWEFLQAD